MVNTGFFRRSLSSASSRSYTSSAASLSDANTSTTSLDSADCNDDLQETLIPKDAPSEPQSAPILSLPVELIQQITSYLDSATAASFCLSSRFICYSVGTESLSKYIEASRSRFEKRRTIEAVVERAFPGHWFCAWCDKFHSWPDTTGPTVLSKEPSRDCAEFNSYLHDRKEYVLCYHHVRLALNHFHRGVEHGIPLSSFTHSKPSMAKIFRTPVPTKLEVSAKISSNGHFLLHTSFAIILPTWTTTKKDLISHLWPHLPHILVGHRDSEHGHTGLMAAVDNVARRNWQYLFTQMCSTCATDWTVACHHFPHATGGQSRLVIQTWRDLGEGRNPFDTAWRAHGVCMKGLERTGGDVVRVTGLQAGDIRKSFDRAGLSFHNEACVERAERAMSPGRTRIYRAFMRREPSADDSSFKEVRRSRARARPRPWRTASENEEVARLEEEDQVELERQVDEDFVRADAGRWR